MADHCVLPEARRDARREARVLQFRRILDLAVGSRQVPFVVHDLSSTGAAGRHTAQVETGERVALLFENGYVADGRVRWTRRSTTGLEFRDSLPRNLICPTSRIRRPRADRTHMFRLATLQAGGQSGVGIIRNISAMGLMVETLTPLRPGQLISVTCGGFRCSGQVRWAVNERIGIKSFEPMNLSEFGLIQFKTENAATASSAFSEGTYPSNIEDLSCSGS